MSLVIKTFDKKTWSFAILFAATLVGLLLLFSLKTAQAADPNERVVTIHDKSLETTIVTRATTVSAALEQAKLQTSTYDNVDPGLDTKLTDTSYQINIYRAQPVMVIDGAVKKSVMTAYETPSEIAKDAGLPLFDEDTTTLTRSSNVIDSDGAGLTLTIDRATKFALILYGKAIEARTQASTVADMMREKNIKLAASDTVSVPLNTKISPDLRVEIWRNGVQTINEDQPVAFPVQQIQDASQPVGYKLIKTPGVLGRRNVTFEVNIQNGKEVARREIQSVQTLAPQLQVEIIGTKPSFSGDFAAALAKLRSCEGGYSSWNSAGPYYGAYQFSASAWANNAPAGAQYGNATPAEQDQAAYNYYINSGWRPWPNCGANLPDIYR